LDALRTVISGPPDQVTRDPRRRPTQNPARVRRGDLNTTQKYIRITEDLAFCEPVAPPGVVRSIRPAQMRRVYVSPDSIDAYVVQTYLEANGIESVVVNEHLPVATFSSAPDGTPTVSVVNDEDEERALHLIEERKKAPSDFPPWRCKDCHEENEGAFGVCWKCGALAPPLPAEP
jgi:hypothetical protein